MKIKTFQFYVNLCSTFSRIDGREDSWMIREEKTFHLSAPDEIDDTINEFITDKMITDIKVNDFAVLRSNNGYGDLIKRTYTIIYND